MNSFREWLNTLFGSDGGRAVQMLFALLLVVLLILAVTWLFRRLFGVTLQRGRSSRLSLVDSTVIDQNRRLMLLRRDDVEHLVMIGGPNDILVESRILKAAPALAGRPAPQAVQRPQIVPAAEAEPPIPAPETAEPVTPAVAAVRAKAAAGAATLAAAVVSAGTLLRSRIGRSEEPEAQPTPSASMAAPAERRTLDEAFDAPLGRTAEPVAPAPLASAPIEPPARAAPLFPPLPEPILRPIEPARVAPARVDPFAAEPPAPTTPRVDDRFADGLARALAEPTPLAPEPPVRVPASELRPPEPPRTEIDLLADLEAIGSEIARAPEPEIEPVAEPVEIEPIEIAVEEADPRLRLEPRFEPRLGTVAPAAEPAAEETAFDFDFDFDHRPAPEPEPDLLPTHAPEPEPEIAEEPAEEAPSVIEEEPPVEEEPAIEFVRTPEPPHAAASAPTPTPTPAPASTVDELEEEMARLLAELSGQTRR